MKKSEYLRHLVAIPAAGYDFHKPIKWASGTYNPMYVDNRIGISVPESRRSLKKELPSLVDYPDTIDYVFGIPKAGIAPATLLAAEIGKPLLIKHNDSYYSIDLQKIQEWVVSGKNDSIEQANTIAATVPFGIPFGIMAAEHMRKPFLFVREKPKDHGKMKQVEGIVVPGGSTVLIDPIYINLPTYFHDAVQGLRDAGIKIISHCRPFLNEFIKRVDIDGMRIISMEDLVSTGESSLEQTKALLLAGAIVFPTSVFSYNLPSAMEAFAKYGLVNKSIITFVQLVSEYKNQNKLSAVDEDHLLDWYHNQPTWGDTNGFPSAK